LPEGAALDPNPHARAAATGGPPIRSARRRVAPWRALTGWAITVPVPTEPPGSTPMSRAATLPLLLSAFAALRSGIALAADAPKAGAGQAGQRVYELRTYTTHPGRLDALNKRFREHTCRLFQKHGMELIGFWTPQDDKDGKSDKLIYLLAFPSRDAAKASWKA